MWAAVPVEAALLVLNFKMTFFPAIAIVFLLCLSCTSFPFETTREPENEIKFSEAFNNPEAYNGSPVIWGGIIIETVPRPDDTLIIIRQTELDFQNRPQNPDQSEGRFIARHEGFLDPAIYNTDREITVAGIIAGTEKRLVGEYQFSYPLVDVQELTLWEKRSEAFRSYDPMYMPPSFFFWHPYYLRPYPWHYSPYWR